MSYLRASFISSPFFSFSNSPITTISYFIQSSLHLIYCQKCGPFADINRTLKPLDSLTTYAKQWLSTYGSIFNLCQREPPCRNYALVRVHSCALRYSQMTIMLFDLAPAHRAPYFRHRRAFLLPHFIARSSKVKPIPTCAMHDWLTPIRPTIVIAIGLACLAIVPRRVLASSHLRTHTGAALSL